MRLSLFVNQCTTIQYVNSLKVACDTLREIIAILGPIRVDSVEGGNGLKVTPPPPLYLAPSLCSCFYLTLNAVEFTVSMSVCPSATTF